MLTPNDLKATLILQDCVAVGDYVDAQGRQMALAENWDGKRWALQIVVSVRRALERLSVSRYLLVDFEFAK